MVRLESEGPGGVVALRLDLPATTAEEASWLDALARTPELPGPYGLLMAVAGHGAFSEAGRRAQALWYKANRRRLEGPCRALAVLRPDAPDGGERSARGFGRMFAFPVAAARDEAAARAFLARHLRD